MAECAGQPGGSARAVQEATHCQRPVPEPGSRSPRRCTLSLCVGRQQSHSVPEKEACVSHSPSSKHKDGHANGPFTGHPSLPASNHLHWTQASQTLRPKVPIVAWAQLTPQQSPRFRAGCRDPTICSRSVGYRMTHRLESIYLLGEEEEGSCGSCTF